MTFVRFAGRRLLEMAATLAAVGLTAGALRQYPGELSGGMLQGS